MPASDTSGKSIKSTRQPSKTATALKWKASKVISAIVPKKKKKTLTGDTLSMSSIESVTRLTMNTEQSSGKDSSSQPTVIDIDSNEEVENPEDPDVELGKVMA